MGSEILTSEGFRLYYHPSANKKFNETVVFVHHMWGNHKSPGRHYRYLNEKGFDCISFDLVCGSKKTKFNYHPLFKYFYKGVFYIWARQIRSTLNFIEGEKIIYSFSGPALSAFWACEKRTDIKKIICDGGPFEDVYSNTKNLFRNEVGLKNKQLIAFLSFVGKVVWGYRPLTKLAKVLNKWPQSIPILSIRGVRDNIVDIDSIRNVFNKHIHLDIEIFELMYGKHLDGMRDFPEQYCKKLLPFIKKDLKKIDAH